MGAITLDKKNLNNKLNVVLLHDIGDSYIHPTTAEFFGQYSDSVL